MLILSRRIGESIVISDNIHITVLRTNGGQIRMGIDAPKNVPVHRQEIYDRIHKQQQESKKLDNELKNSDESNDQQ